MPRVPVTHRYTLEEPLGPRGVGESFAAHDRILDREVEVALLPSERPADAASVAAFRLAARAAGTVADPGIAGVFDGGLDDAGRPFLVAERLDGPTLAGHVAARGPLGEPEALRIGAALAATLAATHRAGVVHGRLTPDGVVLGHDGRVVITDLGLATTSAGAFTAPEVRRGERPTAAADVYALGALVVYALAGPAMHSAGPSHELGALLPGVRETTRATLRRALADVPAARWLGMLDLGDHLRPAALRASAGAPSPARSVVFDTHVMAAASEAAPARPRVAAVGNPPVRRRAERPSRSPRAGLVLVSLLLALAGTGALAGLALYREAEADRRAATRDSGERSPDARADAAPRQDPDAGNAADPDAADDGAGTTPQTGPEDEPPSQEPGRVQTPPPGAGLDGGPPGAGGDGRPSGAGLDGGPPGAGGDGRPSGAGRDGGPHGASGETWPRGAGGDGGPRPGHRGPASSAHEAAPDATSGIDGADRGPRAGPEDHGPRGRAPYEGAQP